MHVSLAYKMGAAFTLYELNEVHPWLGPPLEPKDLELMVWSCHAKSPRFWRRVLG